MLTGYTPRTAYGPALAIGGMNFGTRTDKTDYNIGYALAAKTLGLREG